ncbi:T6SS immunity protein Tdi1 domain-containing protein [Stenotrophomonas geniculata]|uniref:T6SS immunity protein Tdi1 domain-containing protein n=1 Tax=Stenotrophomonas TaxID=40323 RepID=UPI0009F281C3|nr:MULTISPECIES: T6SS immunity protein Tdi1 domain-containing protein [Stenotrophomonas]MCF3497767.1 DUF1851 domain-containing protein [Stenotrophomonas maltophilia]MCI1103023.1 DUF1851 domain-containing protein [Stenotrophomonas maltophilia]MDQ4678987.1 DUF1851 domain-containing protein [Stenotrophomonas maltophilia group sp. RNC7]PSD10556.1 DUF1851 domain-containing protein [Stenotrophomonas maltophilia]UGB20335.1 DUF1851 domain-containing protein [Stenotrophomonas maltophilia]
MSKLIDYIVNEHGHPKLCRSLTRDEWNSLPTSLPDQLRELFAKLGFFFTLQGQLQTCHPRSFKGILDAVFDRDEQFNSTNCHAFCHSAFGNIFFYHEVFGIGEIELMHGSVMCETSARDTDAGMHLEHAIEIPFMLDAEDIDAYDKDDRRLFSRARKKLGPLEIGECYGFQPLLSLGGENTIENLKKVEAIEHLGILCQTQDFSLYEYSSYGTRALVRSFS